MYILHTLEIVDAFEVKAMTGKSALSLMKGSNWVDMKTSNRKVNVDT